MCLEGGSATLPQTISDSQGERVNSCSLAPSQSHSPTNLHFFSLVKPEVRKYTNMPDNMYNRIYTNLYKLVFSQKLKF